MDIGPIEIGLVIIVFLLVIVISRFFRKHSNRSAKTLSSPETQKIHGKAGKDPRRNYVGIAGFGIVLIGIILLLSGMNMFKFVFWSYSWFFILVVIGLLLLFIPWRR